MKTRHNPTPDRLARAEGRLRNPRHRFDLVDRKAAPIARRTRSPDARRGERSRASARLRPAKSHMSFIVAAQALADEGEPE